MEYLLFYRENTTWAQSVEWLDKLAGTYNLVPIIIDLLGDWSGENVYSSLQEAVDDPKFDGHTWAWLDFSGTTYLDEYAHPATDVIYCIGSDVDGFGDHDITSGDIVKLDQPSGQEGEWFAAIVAPLVIYDRFLYLEGRRV